MYLKNKWTQWYQKNNLEDYEFLEYRPFKYVNEIIFGTPREYVNIEEARRE